MSQRNLRAQLEAEEIDGDLFPDEESDTDDDLDDDTDDEDLDDDADDPEASDLDGR